MDKNIAASQDEIERLKALRRYDVLDTPPDGAFDHITAMAAYLFRVPIALVSLVDHDRIWFKSHHGIEACEVERKPGLCASAMLSPEVYEVRDAKIDPRTLAHPLVAGSLGLRFYAAAPLRTHDGFNLGTLCIIDREPRELAPHEKDFLTNLATFVMDQMELRLAARKVARLEEEVKLKLLAKESALQLAHERSSELARRLLTSQEEERTRIADELHDDVSQQLAAMSISLSAIKRRLPHVEAQTLQDIDQLQKEAGALAETIRLLSHDLHPAVLRHIGIVAALQTRCRELGRKADLNIAVQSEGELGKMSERVIICLFRVAQEALHNIIKHAHADHVKILLFRRNNCVELAVIDDGNGFDTSDPRLHKGLGFISMEERIRIVGGTLAIESRMVQGTTVRAKIPLEN